MWANDPEMAKKWEKNEKMKKETKVKQLIKKMVREIMTEAKRMNYKERDWKKINKIAKKKMFLSKHHMVTNLNGKKVVEMEYLQLKKMVEK